MHQNLCGSATIATLIYLEHLLKWFFPLNYLVSFLLKLSQLLKQRKQGCYRLSQVILAPSFFSGEPAILWIPRDAPLEKNMWRKKVGRFRWYEQLTFWELPPDTPHFATCKMSFMLLMLGSFFSNKKNKSECKLSCSITRTLHCVPVKKTLHCKPWTCHYSVFQQWTCHLVYWFPFVGNWNMQQNVFVFMLYLFCTAEKISK